MSKKLTAILLALVLCAALLPLGLSPITAAGSGTKADPILVGTPADFNNIRNNLKAYYKLTADIDLSGFCTGEEGWEPIGKDGGKDGSKGDRFEGGLNGAGYKITGLKINRVEADGKPIRDIGLFGAASITAEFENINLVDVDIKGGGCVGGLVGRWGNEYWRDCCEDMIDMDMTPGHSHSEYYVTRYGKDCKEGIFKNIEISGEITGYYFVGGVIGYTDGWESTGGSIENAVNKAKVSGNSPLSRVPALDKWRPDGTYVGGIIGKMRHAAPFKLTNCVNHGDIYNRQSCTGGIVGSLAGGNPELHGMRFCANFGNIHSEGGLVGGLVGTEAYRNELPRTIEDCFSGGRIFGVTKIGGIMGDGGAEITRCAFINTTDVAPTDTAFAITGLYVHSRFAGGIIGHAMSETKITDCFALFTLCANNPDMVGGAVGVINAVNEIKNTWTAVAPRHLDLNTQYQWGNAYQEGGNPDLKLFDNYYYDVQWGGVQLSEAKRNHLWPNFFTADQGDTYKGPKDGWAALITGRMKDKANFNGFDFEDVWAIGENSYPYLQSHAELATLSGKAEGDFQAANNAKTPVRGDINGDNAANIDDILLTRDLIFGQKPTNEEYAMVIDLMGLTRMVDINTILAIRDVIFGG